MKQLNLKGKKAAFFGTGDQSCYSDTYVDALGILFEAIEETGAEIIGSWSTEGYTHTGSRAVKGGLFVGLALDEDNQPEKSGDRIRKWIAGIKDQLN